MSQKCLDCHSKSAEPLPPVLISMQPLPFFHSPESPLSCHSNRGQHQSPNRVVCISQHVCEGEEKGGLSSELCPCSVRLWLVPVQAKCPPRPLQPHLTGTSEEARPSASSPLFSLSRCGRKASSPYPVQAHKLARTKEKDSLMAHSSQSSLKHVYFLNTTLLVQTVISRS